MTVTLVECRFLHAPGRPLAWLPERTATRLQLAGRVELAGIGGAQWLRSVASSVEPAASVLGGMPVVKKGRRLGHLLT